MGNIALQSQRDFSAGMISNLNPKLKPTNSCKLLINCDGDDEIGSLKSRLGTGIISSQLVNNKTILGLHDFRSTATSNHALLATINVTAGTSSVVYKVGTGTIRTGLTASKKMRFVTFLDSVLMVNGTDTSSSYNGTTVITTGGAFDLANLPITPSLCAEFLDRVYVAKGTDDTLYYSSVPTSGAISWDTGDGAGSVEIEPEDGGGGITAFGKVPGYLLIFKERSMKRWNYSSAFPESLIDIGTPVQESVVMGHGLCAFFSATSEATKGFYVTAGDRPVAISHDRVRSIKKWVDAITYSNYSSIAGWATDSHFAWSVGDLTVDGVTYNNVVLRWNRVLNQWSVRTYPSQFHVFSRYVDSNNQQTIVGGDDDGCVIQLDKASTYTDYDPSTGSGVPIHWEARLQDEDFGYNQMKTLSDGIVVDTDNMETARLQVFIDGDQKNLGGIRSRLSKVAIGKTLSGTHFGFSMKGTNNGSQAVIREIEVPDITVINTYQHET